MNSQAMNVANLPARSTIKTKRQTFTVIGKSNRDVFFSGSNSKFAYYANGYRTNGEMWIDPDGISKMRVTPEEVRKAHGF